MELKLTTQFKKDLKKYKHDKDKIDALNVVLTFLENEIEIPQHYFPHLLTGQYKGCMECHVKGDFLLVWMDEARKLIKLIRLGSHSELF